jgi:hypothetical protein
VAALTYEYTVGGHRYTGGRLDYAGGGGGRDAGRVLARYRPGAAVTVRYDPRRPERAVLEPGVGVGNYVRLLVAVVVLLWGVVALADALGPAAA